jgi:predicted dienelactone hydrolase
MSHKIAGRFSAAIFSFLALFIAISSFPAAAALPDERAIAAKPPQSFAMWQPDKPSAKPLPLIIYSHGLGGCSREALYLTAALAKHGYIVVAPNHRDSSCGGKGTPADAMEFFSHPEMWNDQSYRHRDMDIRELIDSLKADPQWSKRIDWSKIGIVGQSLGGYTALSLAGAWPQWKTEGVKAVLALAPYTAPLVQKGKLGALDVPVMYQTAKADKDITAAVQKQDGAFDKTSGPAWLVEYGNADPEGFVDGKKAALHPEQRAQTRQDVVYYSEWFFDHTLKGETGKPEKRPEIADFRAK